MKKILTALMALILACSAPALAENAVDAQPQVSDLPLSEAAETVPDPTGTWYLNAFEINGSAFSGSGTGVTLTFNADGTGALAGMNDMTFAWSAEGASLTGVADGTGALLAFAVTEDGALQLTVDGTAMTFSRDPSDAQALTTVTLERFDGNWSCAPAGFTCVIAAGSVTVDGDAARSGAGALDGNALVVDYADGSRDTFYLYNDGTLRLFRSAGGTEERYELTKPTEGEPLA